MRITVVGAGVIGLSTACVLAESGHAVTIIAEKMPEDSTSAVAAAFWEPYHLKATEDGAKWQEDTYHHFMSLLSNTDAGITLTTVQRFFASKPEKLTWETENPWTKTMGELIHYRDIPNENVPQPFILGVFYDVPVIHMPSYLAYLKKRLDDVGIKIHQQKVDNLRQCLETTDLVVNCAGLGNRSIQDVMDKDLIPIRGQIIIVPKLKEITNLTFITTGEDYQTLPLYIVPRGNHDIVLGGTYVLDENTDVSPTISNLIFNRCAEIEPSLINSTNIIHGGTSKVGLRPYRTSGIRLETEIVNDKRIIHNYGHGGGGVTLSWGCGLDVLRKVESDLFDSIKRKTLSDVIAQLKRRYNCTEIPFRSVFPVPGKRSSNVDIFQFRISEKIIECTFADGYLTAMDTYSLDN